MIVKSYIYIYIYKAIVECTKCRLIYDQTNCKRSYSNVDRCMDKGYMFLLSVFGHNFLDFLYVFIVINFLCN